MLEAMSTRNSFDIQIEALDRDKPVVTGDQAAEFWVRDDPIIRINAEGRREIARGGMWPAQREWWELNTFVKILMAGLGFGKSVALCKRAIATGLQNAPHPIAIVSPNFGMARRTIIPTMFTLLDGKQRQLGQKKFWYLFRQNISEFTIKYHGRKATIYILSGDDPQSLKGANLAAAYMDEPFIQPEEVFLELLSRVRHPDAPFPELGLCGTPEQGGTWGLSLVKGKSDISKGLSVGTVKGRTIDNKALDPAYVERLLAKFSKKAAEAYVNGEWVNLTEGRVFYAFEDLPLEKGGNVVLDPREDLIKAGKFNDPRLQGLRFGVGMDFNVTPMSATIFFQVGDATHYFEEILLDNSDTQEMAGELRSRMYGPKLKDVYPDPTGRQRRTSSPEGRTDFYFLEHKGFNVLANYNDYNYKDTLNIVNGRMRPANGSPPKITVSPRCEKLIEYLNTHSHKLANQQQHMKHLLDAFRYPQAYLFPMNDDLSSEGRVSGA